MKRFLRYLLLAGCVMIIAVWGWSIRYCENLAYNSDHEWGMQVLFGRVLLYHHYDPPALRSGATKGLHLSKTWKPNAPETLSERLGLFLPGTRIYVGNFTKGYFLPIWIIAVPFFMITMALWYHPLKAKLRGTDRAGFEVEVKSSSEPPQEKA